MNLTLVFALGVAALAAYVLLTGKPKVSEDDVDDRMGVPQLYLEGLAIVRRESTINTNWAREYHRKHNLTGQMVLLTGSTKGLGRGIAAHLLSFGAKLVLPCRRCDFVVQRDQVFRDAKQSKYRDLGMGVEHFLEPIFVNVDLADWDEIDVLMDELVKLPKLKTVILNAGLVSPGNSTTKQGFESTFGVNFMSAAYLTQRVLDLGLMDKEHGRIVTVSSEDHRVSEPITKLLRERQLEFGQPWGTSVLDAMPRYDYSKLAMVTYFLALANRQPNVQVIDMCPGPVASDIAVNAAPWPIGQLVKKLMEFVMVDIEDASVPVVRLALSDEFIKTTGKHFHITQPRDPRSDAKDVKMQQLVYDWTQALLQRRAPPH
ncbi:hypothetical protein BASA81_016245 [Batrachochytrium salamandrivorans]|nr:hypothetical protein BASA81_016245 [Batrachochytrium salamandrivorans]